MKQGSQAHPDQHPATRGLFSTVLGGPTRNDLEFEEGVPRDYADFVLTVGAPPDSAGAGTYGYGKTAAYSASSCSTILIWSRWRDPSTGQFEERLVASAMGPRFVRDARQFTGRQWWGYVKSDDRGGERVEPAIGSDANQLGRILFERHFRPEETGTSILILDPKPDRLRGEDPHTSTVQAWRSAVRQHLWPKLSEDQPVQRRMTIRLFDHGVPLPVMNAENPSEVLEAAQQCLEAIRDVQAGVDNDNPLVAVREIRSQRPNLLMGHLAVTRFGMIEAGDDMRDMADKVTYMRSSAELVVDTQPFGQEPHELSHWVGVFKPVPSLDDDFAQSEPPAHDAWSYQSMQDERAKGTVRRALNQIKASMVDYLKPVAADVSGEGATSTGALSSALSGLVGAAEGTVATAGRPSRTGSRRAGSSKTPRVQLAGEPERYFLKDQPDRQYLVLPLKIEAGGPALISATKLAIAVEGSSMQGDGEVLLEGWGRDGNIESQAEQVRVAGDRVDVVFSHPSGIAIEVDFKAVLEA